MRFHIECSKRNILQIIGVMIFFSFFRSFSHPYTALLFLTIPFHSNLSASLSPIRFFFPKSPSTNSIHLLGLSLFLLPSTPMYVTFFPMFIINLPSHHMAIPLWSSLFHFLRYFCYLSCSSHPFISYFVIYVL